MTPQELLLDIHALEEELLTLERRYGVRSEAYYPAYSGGEEPVNDEWASVYRTWLERQGQYRDHVQAVQSRVPRLASLVRAAG